MRMDFDECMRWKGHRVWVRVPAAASTHQFGEVMHVFFPAKSDNIEVAIELDDGSVHTVFALDKGALWDLVD
jgi:hypothetical protein